MLAPIPGYMLGTILPTAESNRITNMVYRRNCRDRDIKAAELPYIRKTTKHGDTQYWQDDKTYLEIGLDLRVRKFEIREDGEYFAGWYNQNENK